MKVLDTLTLLLVEADCFTRTGLRSYLETTGCRVIEARNAVEALTKARRERPSVAIVDIVIPANGDRSGFNLQENVGLRLVYDLKEINSDLGIVILSAYPDRGAEVLEMLRFMRGLVYRIKGLGRPEELVEAIHMAARGDVWIDPAVNLTVRNRMEECLLMMCDAEERPLIQHALEALDRLTPAEAHVMAMAGISQTTKGIAQRLSIAPGTVETHINQIYTKLFGNAANDVCLRKSALLTKVALIKQAMEND